jgi:hypothetical protein
VRVRPGSRWDAELDLFIGQGDDHGARQSEEGASRRDVHHRIEREVPLLERRGEVGCRKEIARFDADVQQPLVGECQYAPRCAEVADRRPLEYRHHAKHALARFQRIDLQLSQRDGAAVARIGSYGVNSKLYEHRERDDAHDGHYIECGARRATVPSSHAAAPTVGGARRADNG